MNAAKYENPKTEVIYDRHSDKLYRIAFSILLSGEDAEDAVHDVFSQYITKLPSFTDEAHEEAWFLRCTVNRCKDILRKNKIRRYVSIDEIAEITACEDVHDETLNRILALPEKIKTVILLHYYEGYSVSETAKLLGISESAVKMRLARGREQLKESS